jgi:hypothetical protein
MERQMIKRLTMLGLVSMFTLFAAVESANAQLSNPIRAKIPFDFNVGERKLPAGEYRFSRQSGISDSGFMLVSSVDSKTRVFQSTLHAQVVTPKDQSILVFHKYGDQYFLEQVWSGGEQEGTQLPESRNERTIRLQLAQTQRSNMTGKAIRIETVDVVASLL